MRRLIKTLLVCGILTIIMAVPAMAQEVTDPEKVIKEETFVAGEDALAREFHNSEIWRSNNYISYLDGVIYNLNETVRIKQEIVDNGQIAVVLIEDEATVKRVFYDRESDILTLMPENPVYRPMRYMGAELDQIRILGRVVAVQYEVH